MAHLYKIKQAELDFHQSKSGQTVASIGAQCCHIEAAYGATTDSVTFLYGVITPNFVAGQ